MDRSEQTELAEQALQEARLSSNGWFRACCPFCPLVLGSIDRRISWGLNAETGGYHCWRCGVSGRISMESVTPASRTAEVHAAPEPSTMEPPEGFIPLWAPPGLTAASLEPARAYLKDRRGVGEAFWEVARIGAVLDGAFRNRIIVPVLDEDERWLGYVGRDWTGCSLRKYLYPRGMARGSILYEQEVLSFETDQPCLVVEGVFDALPYLGQVVACLGKPSKAQIELLRGARRPLAICLDGDIWEMAEALAMRLRMSGVRTGFVRLPPGEDPGSVNPSWLQDEAQRCVE